MNPSRPLYITVHDGNGNNSRRLTELEYDELVKSGTMWDFHPDAPHEWPTECCEGCDNSATHRDSEGVPLCKECYDDLPAASESEELP